MALKWTRDKLLFLTLCCPCWWLRECATHYRRIVTECDPNSSHFQRVVSKKCGSLFPEKSLISGNLFHWYQHLVSFAAARAGVTQRSPSPRRLLQTDIHSFLHNLLSDHETVWDYLWNSKRTIKERLNIHWEGKHWWKIALSRDVAFMHPCHKQEKRFDLLPTWGWDHKGLSCNYSIEHGSQLQSCS